jgi:hypothetical protein
MMIDWLRRAAVVTTTAQSPTQPQRGERSRAAPPARASRANS